MNQDGFSSEVPSLCIVWDMSRLAQYAKDPLTFYWKYYKGLREGGQSWSLTWGTLYHEATAFFEKRVFAGEDRESALRETIRRAVPAAIKHRIPMGRFRNDEGEWVPMTGDAAKLSVYALVRALIWFEAEYRAQPFPPICLADGTPALEFNAVMPLDMKAPTGEDYLVVVNIDKIATDDDGAQFAVERKTTKNTLDAKFFSRYDPSFQTYTYDLVCSTIFPHSRLRGVVVEACQTAVEFTRFDRHPIIRPQGAREHWLKVIKYWIKRAEADAMGDLWSTAINTEATFDNEYRRIQRRDPKVWPALLAVDLNEDELWNPMVRRPPLLGE